MKEIIKKIESILWKQIWAGGWNLLNVSDWGEYFLTTLNVDSKPFLKKAVFIVKKGKISAWADEKDTKNFADRMVNKVGNDMSKINKAVRNSFNHDK